MFEWTIATGEPSGVVTMSISVCSSVRERSRTAIRKTDVPHEMLPVRCAIAFVAIMPVPASPSGGQSAMPGRSVPVGSMSAAPSGVSVPASWPALSTVGRTSRRRHGTRPSTMASYWSR